MRPIALQHQGEAVVMMKLKERRSLVADRIDRLDLMTVRQVVVALAGLAALIYANALPNGFVFDDFYLIVHNSQIQNLTQYPKALQWDMQRRIALQPDRGATHRPLRTALLAVQFRFFGLNPIGYRVVNILLHVLNGSLVFVLLRSLLGRARPALFAALLFMVHPIQTEAVAYIAGQRDVLFTTFYLAGFLCFVKYRATQQAAWLGVGALAYILGLLSKEMAITLPLLCIAYDLVAHVPGDGPTGAPPLSRAIRDGLRAMLAEGRKLYLLMGAMLAVILLYFVVISNPSHQRTLYGGGLGPTLNTSARIMVHYLKQLVFPLTLNADYSFNAFPVSSSLADSRGVLAGLVLAVIGYGLVRLLQVGRWAAFGGVWFFITLLPVSQLIPHHELMAEHFLYLPSIGFCLVAAYAMERGLGTRRYTLALTTAFATIVLLLGVRTVVRNRDWKDDLTLWTKTVQTSPQSWRARLNLAQNLREAKRPEEAIEQFRAYSAIEPASPRGEIGIGDTYRQMGRNADAIVHFKRALELMPDSAAAAVGLAQIYADMGEADKAVEISKRVLGPQFRNEDTYVKLGDIFEGAGLHAQAVEAYRKGVELNPSVVTLHTGLGKAYESLGLHDKAIAAYREALKLRPRSASIRNYLGAAYLEAGQFDVAAEVLQEALRLSPDYAEAHSNLGIALFRLGRQAEAEAQLRRALALQPDSREFKQNLEIALNGPTEPSLEDVQRAVREAPNSAKAHFNLGRAYGNKGDLIGAGREFRKALELDPRNPLIHYAIGLLHDQKGDRDAARRSWERAVEIDPDFAPAKSRLGEVARAAVPVSRQIR